MILLYTKQRSALLHHAYVMIDSKLIADNLTALYRVNIFLRNLELIAVSQYHMYVIDSIIHYAYYVLVARDFFSSGTTVVAFAIALVVCFHFF